MAWLFFMDESGHDHKNLPFEVRGGVAIHVSKVWNFIRGWRRLEQDCFGANLSTYGTEAKGEKLLAKNRFRWAMQGPPLQPEERRRLSRQFLESGKLHAAPSEGSFTAFGQASLEMARGVFDLLIAHDAKLFASLIPKGSRAPPGFSFDDYLRKDHVFLFERFFYFLESNKDYGVIVMDESEKSLDRRFVARMESYFEKTATGRNRSYWITPVPLFVASDMSYLIQAADICLYTINWGFRLPYWEPCETREEIAEEFGPKLSRLQWHGDGYREGRVFATHGITLVTDPFESRA